MKIQVQGPIIKHWRGGIEIVRAGRGYSKAELDEVGLRDVRIARNHGIPVDKLRNTSYPENVEQLAVVAKTIIDSRKPKTEKRDNKKTEKRDNKKTEKRDNKKTEKRDNKKTEKRDNKKTEIKKNIPTSKNRKPTKQTSE
jgi:DNA-binding NtrC family response regulator